MTDLQAFKAAVRVGATFEVADHKFPELNGERTVTKVQTQRFRWTLPADHPKVQADPSHEGSWCELPKASEVWREGEWWRVLFKDGGGWALTFKCRTI